MTTPFLKMNGAGNDFVIFDARRAPLSLTPEQLRRMADRSNALTRGCDQVIVIEPPPSGSNPAAFMRIFNADGGQVDACGNATRCVGWLLMEESGAGEANVHTNAGVLKCRASELSDGLWKKATGIVSADMGEPRFAWDEIPLSHPANDTLRLEIEAQGLSHPASVGMGNPHVVFFAENAAALERIEALGPEMQRHPLFAAHGVNVTIAHVSPVQEHIAARVWERGVGLTAACGTAACATAVAAIKRGHAGRNQEIGIMQMMGAQKTVLYVRWQASSYGDAANNRVFLTGPVQKEFEGKIAL